MVSTQNVIERIKKTQNWEEYKLEDITKQDGDAYVIASAIVEEGKPQTSQMRKFYQEALKGQYYLNQPNNPRLEDAKTTLFMLLPRIHYSINHIDKTFIKFMEASLDTSKFRSNDPVGFPLDYDKFMSFFESVVGYHAFLSDQNESNRRRRR